MSENIQQAVDRVIDLAEEVETHAAPTLGGSELDGMRQALHAWIDSVSGVVVNAALGRVTLIHDGGRTSSIASSDLPFILSRAGA
jgi:hypothetical protein